MKSNKSGFFIFLALSVFLNIASFSRGVQNTLKERVEKNYQNTIQNYNARIVEIMPIEVMPELKELCKPYRFYRVGIKFPEKERLPRSPEITYNKIAVAEKIFPVRSAREVSSLFSELKIPVENEVEALQRVFYLAGLIEADVKTSMPSQKSIIKKYQIQDPKNWKLIISELEKGWKVSVTLMTDKVIKYCVRYEFKIAKSGEMSVIRDKNIYSYTLYE